MASVFLSEVELSDYIGPSEICVKPIVTQNNNDFPSNRRENPNGSVKVRRVDSRNQRMPLRGQEKATVSAVDCLACSGCVTSAESILVTSHSIPRLREERKKEPQKFMIVTISPTCIADLSRYLSSETEDLNVLDFFLRLKSFLEKELGANLVVDGLIPAEFSLIESANEFCQRFRSSCQEKICKVSGTPNFSSAISSTQTRKYSSDGIECGSTHHLPGRDDEFYESLSSKTSFPMLTSSCPGFVCYVEKTAPLVLPHLSSTKSPMAINGALFKHVIPSDKEIYHLAVMPCHDKKLEASRKDFLWETPKKLLDIDLVITTSDLLACLEDAAGSDDPIAIRRFFNTLPLSFSNILLHPSTVDAPQNLLESYPFSSGGYADYIFRFAAKQLFQYNIPLEFPLPWKSIDINRRRKNKDLNEITLYRHFDGSFSFSSNSNSEPVLKFAMAYGFKNIQRVIHRLTAAEPTNNFLQHYHYIEVMACPRGCINGGGQIHKTKNETPVAMRKRLFHNLSFLHQFRNVEIGNSLSVDSFLQTIYHRINFNHSIPMAVNNHTLSMQEFMNMFFTSQDITNDTYLPFNAIAKQTFHTRFHAIPKLQLSSGSAAGIALMDTKW